MTLQPLEYRLLLEIVAFLDLRQNRLDKVLVLNRFAGGCDPIILAPFETPRSHAVDGVPAVREDGNVAMARGDIKGSKNSSELGALVCLAMSFQGFGHISARNNGVSD